MVPQISNSCNDDTAPSSAKLSYGESFRAERSNRPTDNTDGVAVAAWRMAKTVRSERERVLDRRKRSVHDVVTSVQQELRELTEASETAWTPGQVCGAIVAYLDRAENFSSSTESAIDMRKRLQCLTRALYKSTGRIPGLGCAIERFDGLYIALAEHDETLSRELSLKATSVRAARDLVRLEVAFVTAGARQTITD